MLAELLMNHKLRRYIESLIVVWCPWVLWLEQPSEPLDFPFVLGEEDSE